MKTSWWEKYKHSTVCGTRMWKYTCCLLSVNDFDPHGHYYLCSNPKHVQGQFKAD